MAVVKLVIGAKCDNMSKRFNVVASELGMYTIYDNMGKKSLSDFEAVKLLNKYGEEINLLKNDFVFKDKFINDLKEENEQLKSEINMLKTTICRNEAYIKRLTEKSEWRVNAYD